MILCTNIFHVPVDLIISMHIYGALTLDRHFDKIPRYKLYRNNILNNTIEKDTMKLQFLNIWPPLKAASSDALDTKKMWLIFFIDKIITKNRR